jgi:[ribosomal protein S5]-alanine N-acetyltransferase
MIGESKRVYLREFKKEDGEFIFQLVNMPSWIAYIGDRNIRSIQDAENYIEERLESSYKKNGYGLYAVVEKNEKEVIGMCGLVKRDYLPQPDIGFAMMESFQNMGYGRESAEIILKISREVFHLNKIYAIITPNNDRSINLVNKLNFTYEQTKTQEDTTELLVYSKTL